MSERVCLRCDWTGETDGETCPRCGAALYRIPESTKPREVIRAPRPQPEPSGDRMSSSPIEETNDGESVPPAVAVAANRRWWVIAGGAFVVAAVWVVATGGPFARTDAPVVPGAAGNGAALDPFISINAQLSVDHPVVDLFKVETNDPQYWQLSTLDQFDGESWRSSDPDGTKGGIEAGQIVHVSPPVTPPSDSQTRSTYTFTILSSNRGHALPMPEQIIPPTHLIDVPGDLGGDLSFDPYLDQTFVGGGLDEGDEYTIRSRIAVPTAGELDQVHNLPSVQYGRWTELPDDLDPRFEQTAQGWTADATSAYDKVLAIQRHFHSDGFTYSTDVGVADDGDALLTFLTQTKTGFCQQYASAMAVLVRELGLPARIAVGYQAGTLQDDGTYLVQSTNAHAWVEVFFEGYGWLSFEPTPGHGAHPDAQLGTYLNP